MNIELVKKELNSILISAGDNVGKIIIVAPEKEEIVLYIAALKASFPDKALDIVVMTKEEAKDLHMIGKPRDPSIIEQMMELASLEPFIPPTIYVDEPAYMKRQRSDEFRYRSMNHSRGIIGKGRRR